MGIRTVPWNVVLPGLAMGLAALSCGLTVDFDDYTFDGASCVHPSDCPRHADPCIAAQCVRGGCSYRIAERGRCDPEEINFCNALGKCVECVDDHDCPSGACVNDTCVCHDGRQNGDETSIDCGGAVCAPCGAGKTCAQNNDCLGGTCSMGVCAMCGDTEWAQWTPGNADWIVREKTARDKRTGLTWTREASSTAQNWEMAKMYCENLKWRLPTRIELTSIVDYEKSTAPAVDTQTFRTLLPLGYWTSTPRAGDTSYAWVVSLERGYVTVDSKNRKHFVVCVR